VKQKKSEVRLNDCSFQFAPYLSIAGCVPLDFIAPKFKAITLKNIFAGLV